MSINSILVVFQQIKIDDVSNYLIWLDLIMAIIYLFYTAIMIRNYLQKRTIITIYMMLYFLSFASLTLVYFFGHDPLMISGTHTNISDSVAGTGLSITVLSMVFLFGFFCNINEKNKTYTITGSALGFILAFWIILPYDETYNLKMFSYTFMLIYAIWVYVKVIKLFLKMRRIANDDKTQRGIADIILGSLLFLVFMGFMTVAGISNNGILYITSFIIEGMGVTFMYLGFIHPMIKVGQEKKKQMEDNKENLVSNENIQEISE